MLTAAGRLARRPATGADVNNFLNSYTLIQTATDASFFAIMAVGATIVIISGGIDLSVGSIYALAGVAIGHGAAGGGADRSPSRPSLMALGGVRWRRARLRARSTACWSSA